MKKAKLMIAVILTICVSIPLFSQSVSAKINVEKEAQSLVYTSAEFKNYKIPYRLYIPADYDSGKQYPVLFFLHGAGERGSDNTKQFVNAVPYLFHYKENLLKETIIVAPQCPTNEQWVDYPWSNENYSTESVKESKALKTAVAILENVLGEYSCDRDRVYAFGISMGGYGVWDLLARHGELFAAGVPICGGGPINCAEALADIPIWTYHSTNDGIVKYAGTEKMYKAISAFGKGKITFTPVDSSDHAAAWNKASSNKDLIEWLYAQKLSDRLPQSGQTGTDAPEAEPVTDNPAQSETKKTSPAIFAAIALSGVAAVFLAVFIARVIKRKKRG